MGHEHLQGFISTEPVTGTTPPDLPRDVLENIRSVETLSVGPDDVIVITVEDEFDDDVTELKAIWQEATGLPNKVVVLEGASVSVLVPHQDGSVG